MCMICCCFFFFSFFDLEMKIGPRRSFYDFVRLLCGIVFDSDQVGGLKMIYNWLIQVFIGFMLFYGTLRVREKKIKRITDYLSC